jgi:inorganic triphosphatase YgiF
MAHEVELKLRIQPADVTRLRRHPAIRSAVIGKPVTRKLISIYYDTPQLALLDFGISLRVRHMAGNWFQAVKGAGKSLAGLHQRKEWEDQIASGQPDFSKITDPELTAIFDDGELRAALAPIFRTEVNRTEWHLVFDNGDQIELALDVGELVIGERRETICEIELELKGGNTGRLFDLALELQQTIPLELENVSKAQRGYAYYRLQQPVIVKAQPARLRANMSAHEALQQIAWECLSHLQGNQDMVLHGEDIEGVHQMRVALRRLRSAFDVFSSIANKQSCAAITEELRWITGVLGLARDLDVFTAQTLPPILQQLHAHPGLVQLGDKAAAARLKAYAEARAALSSQRYHRILLSLGAWLENQRWRNADSVEYSVRDVARAMLTKRHKQLIKHGKRLMHVHPEERHATRIAAKKLRYAAEFFIGLYPEESSQEFLRPLAKVLDVLGILNDIAVTENLIRCLIGGHPNRPLDESLYLFTGWNACNAMHRMQCLESSWNRFARKHPFWD